MIHDESFFRYVFRYRNNLGSLWNESLLNCFKSQSFLCGDIVSDRKMAQEMEKRKKMISNNRSPLIDLTQSYQINITIYQIVQEVLEVVDI